MRMKVTLVNEELNLLGSKDSAREGWYRVRAKQRRDYLSSPEASNTPCRLVAASGLVLVACALAVMTAFSYKSETMVSHVPKYFTPFA